VVHTKRAARRYLLTGGVARCGIEGCGAPLVGQQRRWKGSPLIPYYSCHPSRGGCSRIGIAGEPLEEHVRDELLGELDRREAFHDAMAEDAAEGRRRAITDALRDLDRQDVELARLWAKRKRSAAAWAAAVAELEAERARLDAELAAVPAPAARLDPGELREGWDLMTVEERRHAVRLYIVRVDIARAVPGRRFDPGRVHIDWREV
jgi:hypothetical protein